MEIGVGIAAAEAVEEDLPRLENQIKTRDSKLLGKDHTIYKEQRNDIPLNFPKYIYPVDKEDGTQEIEQRSQWSAPAWAAYCALYTKRPLPLNKSS